MPSHDSETRQSPGSRQDDSELTWAGIGLSVWPSMDNYEAIVGRRTVHNYTPEPVADVVLQRALEAGLAAPNHRLTEPWRFVRVGPVTRVRLVEIARSLKETASATPLPEAALKKLERKMLDPSDLVVTSLVKHPNPETQREDYAAVVCAIYGMMLALWGEGVGSKWSTGDVTRDVRTYDALAIDTTQQEIVGFLWVGVAAGETPKPRRRQGLAQVLRNVP